MSSTFGDRFKQLRIEKGLKQQELVDEFNQKYHYSFTRAAISQYENNRRIPEIDALKNFAEYFDVSVDYLLGNSDIRKNVLPDLFSGAGGLKNLGNILMENTSQNSLTKRDEKDISKILKETREQLENSEGLMFDGEPASQDAIQSILQAMEMGMALAKQKNKEKYAPKKYRKDNK